MNGIITKRDIEKYKTDALAEIYRKVKEMEKRQEYFKDIIEYLINCGFNQLNDHIYTKMIDNDISIELNLDDNYCDVNLDGGCSFFEDNLSKNPNVSDIKNIINNIEKIKRFKRTITLEVDYVDMDFHEDITRCVNDKLDKLTYEFSDYAKTTVILDNTVCYNLKV